MRRLRRRAAPSRQPASRDRPVAAALAEAAAAGPLVPRVDDIEPALAELPDWFTVTDDTSLDGFDTLVTLADEIHAYCDPAEDGLEEALVDQPGITRALAADRELIHLATRLHRDDVAAAVIRAVIDINRHPRAGHTPAGEVTDAQAARLADTAAPLLIAAGYTQRDDGRYFHRDCGHGIVQVLSFSRGLGELADGTSLRDKVEIRYGVCLPEAQPPYVPADPAQAMPGYASLSSSTHTAPDPAAITDALQAMVLPWLRGTAGRDALAAWAAGDPERIFPPAQRPLLARLFTEWGHRAPAQVVLDHLDRAWPSLAQKPDACAARDALSHG